MTEAQAAEYLGISENHLTIMRKNLKYLEGSYIVYSYVDDNDKDVSVCMYSKDELDKAVEKLMSKSRSSSINFKYIEDAIKESK